VTTEFHHQYYKVCKGKGIVACRKKVAAVYHQDLRACVTDYNKCRKNVTTEFHHQYYKVCKGKGIVACRKKKTAVYHQGIHTCTTDLINYRDCSAKDNTCRAWCPRWPFRAMCRQSCDKTTMEPCLQNHSIPAYQGASRWSQTTSNKKSHREYIKCLGEDCKGKTHNELRSCRALCLKEYQSKLKKSQGDLTNWVACHRTVQVCKGKCRSEKASRKLRCKSCKADCNARYEQLRKSIMGVSHDQTVRPARWCKRLSPIKQCLHPNISVGANNGWKNCPEQYRVTIPNHGQGRHTKIQNTERWTTWRGLNKSIMVLRLIGVGLENLKLRSFSSTMGQTRKIGR